MKPDLDALRIMPREIEGLTGLEVNEIFIGGVFGGTYRQVIWQQPKRLLSFCLTQMIVTILVFIFSLPLGLLVIRDSARSVNELPTILLFLQSTIGTTLILIIAWNIYMRVKARSLQTLSHLLAEIDRYNDVVQAVDVLDQLDSVSHRERSGSDRHHLIEALTVTRNSLICGLMTEKILRQNRRLLNRQYDLFTTIESNLIALKTLEVNHQANEYRELLQAALQIGTSVHQEVHQLSDP